MSFSDETSFALIYAAKDNVDICTMQRCEKVYSLYEEWCKSFYTESTQIKDHSLIEIKVSQTNFINDYLWNPY